VRRRELAARPLFVGGAAGLALHTAVVVSFPHWWGGHGYGPRLFTETLFFQAMIAASVGATLVAAPGAFRGWRRALAALLLWGAVVHGAGALSVQSNRWNWSPREVDLHPERLWSWRDPQFLAWAIGGPRLEILPEPPAPAAPTLAPAPAPRHRRPAAHPPKSPGVRKNRPAKEPS
jgi:hypothetical protein